MRVLINPRHFRYTRTAVLNKALPVHLPDNYWSGLEWSGVGEAAIVPALSVREVLSTNPAATSPRLCPSPVFGTQWGVFAREHIDAGVFLGEYACDVVEGKDLILCQKMDSIMMFGPINTPSDPFLALFSIKYIDSCSNLSIVSYF
jgi:hypothetical protein